MVTMTVPDDGRTFGDLTTAITLTTSSINPGYDGRVNPVTVQIIEDRVPGILVTPTYVQLLERKGSVAEFTVQLTSEPAGQVTLTFQEPTGRVSFFPPVIEVQRGLASMVPVTITAARAEVSCSRQSPSLLPISAARHLNSSFRIEGLAESQSMYVSEY
jgi:hypothetical protein